MYRVVSRFSNVTVMILSHHEPQDISDSQYNL